MVASTSAEPRSAKATKVRAILAAGLVLGIGAAFTLAAWTDDEWVFGQSGNGGGPGTKTYHMEQNTWSDATGVASWSDQGTQDGGALTFSVNADNLVPGRTVYAPMQLRAAAGSEDLVATLAGGMQSSTNINNQVINSTALYTALTYEVKQGVEQASCNAAGFSGAGTEFVGEGPSLTVGSLTAISLPAGANSQAGQPVDICFALTLPSAVIDPSLQGKQTVPLWKFTSTVSAP